MLSEDPFPDKPESESEIMIINRRPCPGNHELAGHFCSQHIFHVKTAGLTRFDRLETPSSASYHQAVAQ
jgi:hypothetical protein